MRLTLTATQARALDDQATVAGELAAIVDWFIKNKGERLIDHPHVFASATQILAKAKAIYDAAG